LAWSGGAILVLLDWTAIVAYALPTDSSPAKFEIGVRL
jgi:hypothetical protein